MESHKVVSFALYPDSVNDFVGEIELNCRLMIFVGLTPHCVMGAPIQGSGIDDA